MAPGSSAPSVASAQTTHAPTPRLEIVPVRVLYDHQVFSRQNAGGASRYFCELVGQFSANPSVQTELLVGATSSVYSLRGLQSPRTHVRAFGAPPLPGLWKYALNEGLGNCVAPLLGKMDVYHPTLYRNMPAVRTRSIVATHHDCTQERFPQEFRYAERVRRAKQAQYARADAIICVSEHCRQELLDFYRVERGKTRVIYHGLTQLPVTPAAVAQLRSQLRREFVLYVGSRPRYKNFGGLLSAFRESGLHRSFDLLAVGGGALSDAEKEAIAKLELTDCVNAVVAASDELLGAAYATAKLFVYPSLSEGFGFPPLEAMAVDCPVLASRSSSIPEICRDVPFYFDPADQDSFCRELLYAMGDEEARRRSVQRGRKVAGCYSWEKCASETLELYRQCL